ncbi:MAG: hypothetical protein JW812_03900, partial [Alphaproteobacteria bacterium]|nr:hypothetical protein [Alphaproteobacteria bacterium]
MTIKIKPEIKKYTGIALVPNKAIVLTVENGKIGIKDEFESNTGKIQAFVWLDGKQATSHAVNGIL